MFSGGIGLFFEAGGFGMFPTLGFGFFLTAAATLYVLRPQPRSAPVLVALFLTTLGSGLLGTMVGLTNTWRAVAAAPPEDTVPLLAVGTAESTYNLVLAFIFMVLAGLLVTIGLVRAARQPA